MKYRIICLWLLFVQNVKSEHKIIDEYIQKINEFQKIKLKLQKETMQYHEQLFAEVHAYGRAAGQVATSAILLAGQVHGKEKKVSSSISLGDCSNIVQAVMAGFVLMVEVARMCHAKSLHKKFIQTLTHDDFVAIFPHLAIVEYQIFLMKTLIQLNLYGDLGEQIFARIALAKMSLPYPFSKFAEKAAQKMYKKSFDKNGNFVLVLWPNKKDPYKKFNKKVAQNWKEIALKAASFAEVIEPNYQTLVAANIETFYNDALIKLIYAGMRNELQEVVKIQEQFKNDDLMQKLFYFYTDVNSVTKF